MAHRASDEYKAFRKAVVDESLLEMPSDLRFWKPAGIGFLTRNESPISFRHGNGSHHVIVDQFTPKIAQFDALAGLRRIADAAAMDNNVSSFWVLDRAGGGGSVGDDELYVFACYDSKEAWLGFEVGDVKRLWAEIKSLSESEDWLRTSWKASGIGFIGRQDGLAL